ncbi:hypothetical protein Glove_91g99 [Diversispora epigaea]|uniref:Uncharacterized protein n=1 Tax=Diversispora epigaea TaxID=1348612 RepID=A0A397J951_9GLOM|nr:hypothetical protein Glove_91g99 [Diversispora epigaea]
MTSRNSDEFFKSSSDFLNDFLYEENYNINEEELNNTYNIDEICNIEPITFDIEAFLHVKEYESSSDTSSFINESITENEDINNFVETTDNDINITIKKKNSLALIPCVVIDKIDRTIQRCKSTQNLQKLWQLIGIWQIDKKVVEDIRGKLKNLGVYSSHFNFDQNRLHDQEDKQLKNTHESIIHKRCCLFCGNYYYFFSRGNNCRKYSWIINGKPIQIPCVGQKICSSLANYNEICKLAFGKVKSARFVCCEYYEKNGGHIYTRPGRCKEPPNCIKDEQILLTLLPVLKFLQFNSESKNDSKANTSSFQKIPSFFTIKTIFKLNQIPILFEEKILDSTTCEKIGIQMANQLWQSHSKLKQNKSKLESPLSIIEYYNAFPSFLIIFFYSFINIISKKKLKETNHKLKSQNKPLKQFKNIHLIKIVTFLASIFITFTFPSFKIWLPQVMASLSRRPRLLSSFYVLLVKCSIISHTNRHERRLKKT